MERKPYTLTLDASDLCTIGFIGHRYGWSEALSSLGEGNNALAEHEAWELLSAFESDTEGGHSFFPMLSHDSELAGKLFALMDEIV